MKDLPALLALVVLLMFVACGGNTILPVGEGIALMKGSTTSRGNPFPTADSDR
jgi:hypothetical protein